MISINQIVNECKNLPYTESNSLDKEIYETTFQKIRNMWEKYGYASTLAALSEVWSFEKAVPFFNVKGRNVQRKRSRTIATLYTRGYNGGVERVNAELMKMWIEMGYRVVFFTREQENTLDYWYPESVKRIVLSVNKNESMEQLQTYCMAEQVDMLVYHDWLNKNFIWECTLMKLMNISVVVYCHGHFSWSFSSGKIALYQPEAFKLCDLVVALSETNARFYQLCGCDSYVVHNPIPSELRGCTPGKKRNNNHILMIGRISYEKYPLDAIEVFKLVHDKYPEAVLDVVGDGDETLIRQMEEYATSKGVASSVIFHGQKDSDEIAEYYKSCCCMIFTSKMEGYPMVVLEAKAYGIPVVMYEMPYLSLIKDGMGVMTSPIGSTNAMACNIMRIMRDEGLSLRLSAEARSSFNSLLSINQQNAWRDIIGIACEGKTVDNQAYFGADDVKDYERCILPVLLEKIKIGYDYAISDDYYHRVGRRVLKVPRVIKHFINRLSK